MKHKRKTLVGAVELYQWDFATDATSLTSAVWTVESGTAIISGESTDGATASAKIDHTTAGDLVIHVEVVTDLGETLIACNEVKVINC